MSSFERHDIDTVDVSGPTQGRALVVAHLITEAFVDALENVAGHFRDLPHVAGGRRRWIRAELECPPTWMVDTTTELVVVRIVLVRYAATIDNHCKSRSTRTRRKIEPIL